MIKKFCDLCGNYMSNDDRCWTVDIAEKTHDGYDRSDFQIGGKWIKTTNTIGDVCINCARKIIEQVEKLRFV